MTRLRNWGVSRLPKFMRWAEEAARDSKDATKVGAVVIASPGIRLLSTYNGPPIGVLDLPERRERPVKYRFASHAEQNLIDFAARFGLAVAGMTMAVTHQPCPACARSIIQAGFACVIVGPGKATMPLDEDGACTAMFNEAGVEVIRYEP